VAGYSGTPLVKKLGLKDGQRVYVAGAPRPYARIVAGLPKIVKAGLGKESLDVVHGFVRNTAEYLAALPKWKAAIRKNGMIWVSWPKKSSPQFRDLTEDGIRDAALDAGLVDAKVCAVDEVWSGVKLVYRLKDR